MNQLVVMKIMTVEELWDQYVADAIYDWDIYQEWTKSDIEQILLDEKVEYQPSDLDALLEYALEMQNEMIEEDKENNVTDLYHVIDDTIADADCSAHLDNDAIGKVLVALACSYFND